MDDSKERSVYQAHGSSQEPSHASIFTDLRRGHRSCVSCYQRKVRCDRILPCTPCARAGITCTYPGSRRETKRPSSIQDISDRLERLEILLTQALSKGVNENNNPPSDENTVFSSPASTQKPVPVSPVKQSGLHHSRSRPWEALLQDGNRAHYVDNTNLLDLFQDEDRINPPELQGIHDETPTPSNEPLLSIGLSPIFVNGDTDLGQLHPDPRLGLRLWTIYTERVDPVLKVLHIPTMQAAMISIISEPKKINPSLEALVFSIYYATMTSLYDEEVSTISGDSRQASLQRYKLGLNQAIIKADLLNEPNLTSLQALAIFATCLRVHDNGRAVWVLIGTAIRLAQSIGIHRDGSSLKLSPFESELRLRLWWQLWLPDSRASEDHGLTNTIKDPDHGTRMPLNVDDAPLYPHMKSLPPESKEWTEATFLLTNIRSTKLLQDVLGSREGSDPGTIQDIEAKRTMISKHNAWMETNFFSLSPASSMRDASRTHYYTACTKMDFMLQLREELHTHSHKEESNAGLRGLEKRPFLAACRTLRISCSLREVSMRYTWLFKAYTQWYALAYILRYLCAFPLTPEKEEAWELVNQTFSTIPYAQELPIGGQTVPQNTGRNSIWKCLALLRRQALNAKTSASSQAQDTAPAAPLASTRRATQANITPAVPQSQDQPSGSLPRMEYQPLIQDNALSPFADQVDPNHELSAQAILPDHWQSGILSLNELAMPEMLYLPEWNDIIN